MTARHLKMELDFQGLIKILAGHLYSKKEIFIRELIQNAHDAIWRRHHADDTFDVGQGRIDIVTDLTGEVGRMVFRDNGIGMTEQDLIDYLSSIGRSGTLTARDEASEIIGQFGIGFLSGFVVASRIEVRTRHFANTQEQASLWVSNGDQDYSITPTAWDRVGTEVTIHIKDSSDRGLLQDEAVRKVINTYADMLRVAIHVNDPHHTRPSVNIQTMPWERDGISPEEMRFDNVLYLEKRVPDSVLEVIPVKEPDVEGLLYITRSRAIGRAVPRTVRVFLKRMFLCDGGAELLPSWATFVNGILNTATLKPNAARDNYVSDGTSDRVRDRLGELVIAHLDGLKVSNPQRLSEILAYQDFGIKAACHYYDEFFAKFGHLLEWRVNPKSPLTDPLKRSERWPRHKLDWEEDATWVTLPDLLAALPQPPDGGPKRLSCFTSRSATSQYFEMADAAGTTTLDASGFFEPDLLKAWAKQHEHEVVLVHVDRQDDPSVFRESDPVTDRAVRELAQHMTNYISPGGRGRVRVEARRMSPSDLTSVLRDSEQSDGLNRAYSILNDPNASGDIKKLAEEMLRMSRSSEMRMAINADNEIVRDLAELVQRDPRNIDANEIMLGLYNVAILANQRAMTPGNAKIFASQFHNLMRRVLKAAREADDLKQQQDAVRREREELRPAAARSAARAHLVGFHVTPFSPAFATIRAVLRELMEDTFHCQLISADQRKYDRWIGGNVRAHIEDADFFVVDLTGFSWNVMIELGAIDGGRRNRPALYIAQVDKSGDKVTLPADVAGLIVHSYVREASREDWAAHLENEFRTDAAFRSLLSADGRAPYISPTVLHRWTSNTIADEKIRRALSDAYPTPQAWKLADLDEIKRILGGGRLAALAAITRDAVVEEAAKIYA
jgi:HSP90 family molecular chaperone